MLREQFEDVLADFGRVVGQDIALVDDTATFTADDDMIVNLHYLDDSDTVLAFAPVGGFGDPDDATAGERALALLRLNDIDGPCEGFTLALDADADLVLAMDRRSALVLASADALAAWIEALVRAVRAVRADFAEHFPTEEK